MITRLFSIWLIALSAPVCGQESRPLVDQVAAALSSQPDDPELLSAQFRLMLARGAEVEALGVGRRLMRQLPEGLQRSALIALVDSLDARVRVNEYQKVLAEATILRERGEVRALVTALARLSDVVPVAFLEYAQGEVYASFGEGFDRGRARRELERFVCRSISGRPLTLLRRYLQEPQTRPEQLRLRAVRLAVQLAAKEEVVPPPVTDLTAWRKRKVRAEEARESNNRRIEKYEAAIQRLRGQLSGPPARLGANVRRIQRDIRANEARIQNTATANQELDREIALVDDVLTRFASLQSQRARMREAARHMSPVGAKASPPLGTPKDPEETALRDALVGAQMLEDEARRRVNAIRSAVLRPDYASALKSAEALLATYEKRIKKALQAYERRGGRRE